MTYAIKIYVITKARIMENKKKVTRLYDDLMA
jgi:hypothetical protein